MKQMENKVGWSGVDSIWQRKCKQQGKKKCLLLCFWDFRHDSKKKNSTVEQVSFVGWSVGNNDKKHTISFDRSLLLGAMLATMTKTTWYPSTGFLCWVQCWQQWQKPRDILWHFLLFVCWVKCWLQQLKKHSILLCVFLLLGEMLATATINTQYPLSGFFC